MSLEEDTDDDVLQKAGAWYAQLLGATERALANVGLPSRVAAALIAALAREGYMIDIESPEPDSK